MDEDGVLLSVGLSKFFTSVAVDPRVAYDVDKDVWGIDVPFYFLRDGDGRFTGGVRMGWTSEEDDFLVSVFVSKALSLGLYWLVWMGD